MLRTVLEDVVVSLHSLVHDGEFDKWKRRDDYFVPRVAAAKALARSLLK